jgi:glucosamine--fructose-6-phosphate aminotransferase (isomerizing)
MPPGDIAAIVGVAAARPRGSLDPHAGRRTGALHAGAPPGLLPGGRPAGNPGPASIGLIVPGQLLAETLARRLGGDPDHPRGLRKVTQTDQNPQP